MLVVQIYLKDYDHYFSALKMQYMWVIDADIKVINVGN